MSCQCYEGKGESKRTVVKGVTCPGYLPYSIKVTIHVDLTARECTGGCKLVKEYKDLKTQRIAES